VDNHNRGLTPVVSKTLAIGIVILYIGMLTAVLYGGVIPESRTATGSEMGDRVLATAAERVQQSVPPRVWHVTARFRVELPPTIRGQAYSIRTSNRSLVLEHPHPSIGGSVPLLLPDTVRRVEGEWHSHSSLVIQVVSSDSGLIIELGGE
jgi:hypothetical protein